MVSNFLQATYNIADMIMAGHYGGSSYAQSAIGNSSTVINLLTQVIIGITIGGGVLIGQYYGAKQKKECQETTGSLFTMGLLIGLGVAIVLFLMANQMYDLDGCACVGTVPAVPAHLRRGDVLCHRL